MLEALSDTGVETVGKRDGLLSIENEGTIIPIFMPYIFRHLEPSNILRISG
jgi:hypothetical protein